MSDASEALARMQADQQWQHHHDKYGKSIPVIATGMQQLLQTDLSRGTVSSNIFAGFQKLKGTRYD